MHALIVVESMFGNTHAIGSSIATGLRAAHPSVTADVVRVADADLTRLLDADLLVVGAPTHWFGIPSERTRRMYLKDDDLAAGKTMAGHPIDPSAGGPRIRDWLTTLPTPQPGQRAATFDTRLKRPCSGGAAPRIAKALTNHGYVVTTKPVGFIVTAMEGPLRAGELQRARSWGTTLLTTIHT
jgi:hypothetical protein